MGRTSVLPVRLVLPDTGNRSDAACADPAGPVPTAKPFSRIEKGLKMKRLIRVESREAEKVRFSKQFLKISLSL
jgi:hypothetical protein